MTNSIIQLNDTEVVHLASRSVGLQFHTTIEDNTHLVILEFRMS